MIGFELKNKLIELFEDETLYGFSAISKELSEKTNCKVAIVTLLPFFDLSRMYNPFEFYDMLEELRKVHTKKVNKLKWFFDINGVRFTTPPASPKDDGEHLAEFSYKWAALNAGLGFIGKNDVFVHYKYAQRVRISCLLVDLDLPTVSEIPHSECGLCQACVCICPHEYISGQTWNANIHRDELVDYKKCATKSKHSGDGRKYLCSYCSLACKYPNHTL